MWMYQDLDNNRIVTIASRRQLIDLLMNDFLANSPEEAISMITTIGMKAPVLFNKPYVNEGLLEMAITKINNDEVEAGKFHYQTIIGYGGDPKDKFIVEIFTKSPNFDVMERGFRLIHAIT